MPRSWPNFAGRHHCKLHRGCAGDSCGAPDRMANFAKGLSKLKLKEAPGYVQEYAGRTSISWQHLHRA